MAINWDYCCHEIVEEIGSVEELFPPVEAWAEEALDPAMAGILPYLDLINSYPGKWVYAPPGGRFPSLAELAQRITSFGIGFGTWSFFAYEDSLHDVLAKVEYLLPADPGQCRVTLNGAQLVAVIDYSISGRVLTLSYPLEYLDLLTVKSYGVAP